MGVMKKRRLILMYVGEAKPEHLRDVLGDFEILNAASAQSLQGLVAQHSVHGIVVHVDHLTRERIGPLHALSGFTAWLPFIVLADRWELEAARYWGELGMEKLLACQERPSRNLALITAALRTSAFGTLLEACGRSPAALPLRMKNAYALITEHFPKVRPIGELSVALRIHRRSLEKALRENIGLSYVRFMRLLRIYEAWHLMQYTDLDNSEIAGFLRYPEETHFARDCRKVFNLKPNELRRLAEKDLVELVKGILR